MKDLKIFFHYIRDLTDIKEKELKIITLKLY